MLIHGINFNVNWQKFDVGTSFFIPCLDFSTARRTIRQYAKELRIKVVIKPVVEEGIQGLRVWRV